MWSTASPRLQFREESPEFSASGGRVNIRIGFFTGVHSNCGPKQGKFLSINFLLKLTLFWQQPSTDEEQNSLMPSHHQKDMSTLTTMKTGWAKRKVSVSTGLLFTSLDMLLVLHILLMKSPSCSPTIKIMDQTLSFLTLTRLVSVFFTVSNKL